MMLMILLVRLISGVSFIELYSLIMLIWWFCLVQQCLVILMNLVVICRCFLGLGVLMVLVVISLQLVICRFSGLQSFWLLYFISMFLLVMLRLVVLCLIQVGMLVVCMMSRCILDRDVGMISLWFLFGFFDGMMFVVVSSGRVLLRIWFLDKVMVSICVIVFVSLVCGGFWC